MAQRKGTRHRHPRFQVRTTFEASKEDGQDSPESHRPTGEGGKLEPSQGGGASKLRFSLTHPSGHAARVLAPGPGGKLEASQEGKQQASLDSRRLTRMA